MRTITLLALFACRTTPVDSKDGTLTDDIDTSAEESQQEDTNSSTPNDSNDSDTNSEDEQGNDDDATDPVDSDSDNDGITDGDEIDNGTNPNDSDSDDDGITDGDELTVGTDPNDSDSDDDGISDGNELIIGTDPNDTDSDDDGLTDGDEINQGTDPTDDDSDDDGISDGDEVANGTDPTDDGLSGDTGDFWDWGDNPNTNCLSCDPAIFSGIYDLDLTFQSSVNSTNLCTTTTSAFMSSLGDIAFTTSCTTGTGASFDFEFDLGVTYANPYASADYAVLFGTSSITLPNGTIIDQTFAPNTLSSSGVLGYVTTLAPANFGPYYDISFIWRVMIPTPSGTIEYIVYFNGFKQ